MNQKKHDQLSESERLAIVDAIGAAEHGNVGEVRVHLEERCPGDDALARAKDVFGKLGMHRTKHATGVLLYVATKDRRAAVYAAEGLYGATEQAVWKGVVAKVAEGYKAGRPGQGLVEALGLVGEVLREHAAGHDEHGDELPNELSEA
jgi:uncharacterized membrane protein